MSTIHRIAWRTIIQMLMLFLLFWIPWGISVLITLFVFEAKGLSSADYIVFGALIIYGIGNLILAVLFFATIGSYLKLSSEGLEYHRWPLNMIACKWSEVERIAQGRVIGKPFATLMIRRNKVGREISLGIATLGSARHKLVALSDFRGWPDGDLAIELKQYAPRLFAEGTDILKQM